MDVSELVRGGLEEALVVYGQTVERAWRDGIEAQVAEQAVERLQVHAFSSRTVDELQSGR